MRLPSTLLRETICLTRRSEWEPQSTLAFKRPKHFIKNAQIALCDAIKRLGYSQYTQVKLFGKVFDLVSDPITDGENLVFIVGQDKKSGQVRRVPIPLPIVHMARQQRSAGVTRTPVQKTATANGESSSAQAAWPGARMSQASVTL
jgi:hypothetical protein